MNKIFPGLILLISIGVDAIVQELTYVSAGGMVYVVENLMTCAS